MGLIMALAATGCATMDEDECLTADWRAIGYEDGLEGREAARIGEHREACAEYGVPPDVDAYRAGRREGLREYCKPSNGYRRGVRGAAYRGVCPTDAEGAFRRAYRHGKDVHAVNTEIARVEDELRGYRRALDEIEHEIELTLDEVAHAPSPHARHELVADVRALRDERDHLETSIAEAELHLEDLQYERAELKAGIPYSL